MTKLLYNPPSAPACRSCNPNERSGSTGIIVKLPQSELGEGDVSARPFGVANDFFIFPAFAAQDPLDLPVNALKFNKSELRISLDLFVFKQFQASINLQHPIVKTYETTMRPAVRTFAITLPEKIR